MPLELEIYGKEFEEEKSLAPLTGSVVALFKKFYESIRLPREEVSEQEIEREVENKALIVVALDTGLITNERVRAFTAMDAPSENRPFWELTGAYVRPEERGKKLSSLMIDLALSTARELGAVEIRTTMMPSTSFLKKRFIDRGFREKGEWVVWKRE